MSAACAKFSRAEIQRKQIKTAYLINILSETFQTADYMHLIVIVIIIIIIVSQISLMFVVCCCYCGLWFLSLLIGRIVRDVMYHVTQPMRRGLPLNITWNMLKSLCILCANTKLDIPFDV